MLIASVKTSQGKKVVLKIVLVVDVINVAGLLSFFFSYYFRKKHRLGIVSADGRFNCQVGFRLPLGPHTPFFTLS